MKLSHNQSLANRQEKECVCVWGGGGGEWVVVVVKVSWIDATSKLVCDNISKCCSKYILAW